MIHRFLSLLCAACLLFMTAAAETPDPEPASSAGRLAELDIISQLDDRFRDEAYVYRYRMFFESACLPSSIYNALVAILGTPDTDGPQLLYNLLVNITSPSAPHGSVASVDRVPYVLTGAPADSSVGKLVSGVEIRTLTSVLNLTKTRSAIAESTGPLLLIDKFNMGNSLTDLVELILELDAMGLGHARLAFCSVGAGYGSMNDAPFGSGESGHYIALYLDVDEFCRTGTFYLLDSLPRALSGEPFGEDMDFVACYPFIRYENMSFNHYFSPVRISPTVVQFNLNSSPRAELDALLTDPDLSAETRLARLTSLHIQRMSSVRIWGVNQVFLYIPEK